MDTALYQDTGGKRRFSTFGKSHSEDTVPIERLVMSMGSHLMNGKTPTNDSPASGRRSQVAQLANEQLTSQLDRSFCLNLDHQTLTTLLNSDDKSIEFEIPASSHPRLDTPFYNALRKKYPKAFIRRASLSSLLSEPDADVVGSTRKPKSKPALAPKPNKLLDHSISGSSKRLQSQSHHGSTVSLNADLSSSPAFKRTDSMLSLKERLQQNQDQWKKVMVPGKSPFHRQRFQKSRGIHSRSASVPDAASVDIVPSNAPVLIPKDEDDIQFEAKTHMYQSRNRRFASPDSSHDSAVDMDSASLQSSPTSDKQDEANRLSRQQNRSVMPAKDRPPRSRTPKLKSARAKLPNASGASGIRSMSVPESDGDSGIAAAHWANQPSVESSVNDKHNVMEDHILIIKNELSAISAEGAPRVHSSLELLEESEDLRSSRDKVKFADDQVDPLNTSERYIADDESSSSQGTMQGNRMSTFKPNGPIETLTASTRRKNAKAALVLSPKPPLPKPSLSRQDADNTSQVSFYSANIDGGRKAKKEKKKSLLPWKRSKGKYTPSKEEHLVSPMMTPSASPVSVRSFATVNARPKRRSSVIESASVDEGSSQGNEDDESFYDTDFANSTILKDSSYADDDDSFDDVDYSTKPPKVPSSTLFAANDSQEITAEPSNLQKSKDLSGSRTSLKEQFGNWRSNAKEKMGNLRRAISTEKVDREVEENGKAKKTSGKMKKSSSLQSLTKIFKGKRGSKDKSNDAKKPPSGSSQSSFRASKRSLTKQDLNSDPNQTPQHVRSIGKLMHVNEDGTQIIELARPKDGPMGFYVAKGNAQYKHGFFVSRISDALPEHFFAGIMTVGDEILEINGRKVVDMALEGVYDLLGNGNKVVLRLLPYAARQGSNLI